MTSFVGDTLLVSGAALVTSLAFGIPLRLALEHFRILDSPNQRSSHDRPTPRGGGIGILAVVVIGCLVIDRIQPGPLLIAVPLIACGVALVSLVDDVRGLSSSFRLGTHIAGAALLLWFAGFGDSTGAGIVQLHSVIPKLPVATVFAVLLFGIVGYTNAFNFMDGINGIAAIQAGLSALAMGVIGGATGHWDGAPVLFSLVVAGAALGFLPHNFPSARMFMGDVGSAPLGMLLAFLPLWICREYGFQLFIPLALLQTGFALDTAITLVRRIARGENWLQPHREHFYQRLIRSGKSHVFVTGCEAGLLLVTALVCIGIAKSSFRQQTVAGFGVVLMWCVFFGFAEVTFRRGAERHSR